MFCDICQRQSVFGFAKAHRLVDVKGEKIPVSYKARVCLYCGTELYDENLELEILQDAISIYQKKKRLLPAEEIREYMDSHGLTAAEMAEKVGCAISDILNAQSGRLLDTEMNKKIKKAMSA